jgi:hypothetical protein
MLRRVVHTIGTCRVRQFLYSKPVRGRTLSALMLISAGCVAPRGEQAVASGGPEEVTGRSSATGTVTGQWSLPGGTQFSTATYTLANGANSYSGSLDLRSATTLTFVVGSVVAGNGYTLSLAATSDDGKVSCLGSSTIFNVLDQETTLVSVQAACTSGGAAGAFQVGGVMSNCPIWTQIVVNPSVAYTSSPVQITATAMAPDPASTGYQWTSSAGTLGGATTTDAGAGAVTFTCPDTPGLVALTLVVTDGPLPEGGSCDPKFSRATFAINCVPPSPCGTPGAGCGDGTRICNTAGLCVPALFSVVVLSSLDGGVIDNASTYLPMAIQKYDLTGAPVGAPLPLPTQASGAQQPISITGNNITEGDLTTSADGRFLVTTGWNVPPGGQAGAGTSAVVARIDSSGSVDTSTVVGGAFTPTLSTRSAVSKDGTGFWVSGESSSTAAGNAGGLWYVPFGASTATQLLSAPDGVTQPPPSLRWLRTQGGRLFGGFDQAPPFMAYLGNLPTSGTVTPHTLPGTFSTWGGPAPSPYGFLMFNLFNSASGVDTIYIADDGINPTGPVDTASAGLGSTGNGGLSKWSFDASTGWYRVWSVNAGTWAADAGVLANAPIGFRGLAGFAMGAQVTVMATTADSEGNPDSLAVLFVDNNSASPPTPTIVATTPPSQVFRGVALTPQ